LNSPGCNPECRSHDDLDPAGVESKAVQFDPYGVQPHVVNYPGFHPGLFEVKPAGLPWPRGWPLESSHGLPIANRRYSLIQNWDARRLSPNPLAFAPLQGWKRALGRTSGFASRTPFPPVQRFLSPAEALAPNEPHEWQRTGMRACCSRRPCSSKETVGNPAASVVQPASARTERRWTTQSVSRFNHLTYLTTYVTASQLARGQHLRRKAERAQAV
jgi:hypothetical protein